jgi:hypothetical protein
MGCSNCQESTRKKNAVLRKKIASENQLHRFSVFAMSQLKNFVVFYELMQEINASIDDVRRFIVDETARDKAEGEASLKIMRHAVAFMNMKPKCPECNANVEAIEVNTMRCNKIGGKYKYLIYCVDWKGCGWDRAIASDLLDFMQSNRRKNLRNLSKYIESGGREK